MAKEKTSVTKELEGLELEIMDARQRIDVSMEEINRLAKEATDVNRLVTEYRLALTAAAFTLGLVLGLSLFAGGRVSREKKKRRPEGIRKDRLFEFLAPVARELLLRKMR
ncbi:MAG: hypothetical protein M1335_05380 [Chloroflexi bacterium]|nr:hypothetical protein [Chloroflexota bacterium]